MSDLVQKLLDASDKSDGWDAWCLAPIAAEYIKDLEEQRDDLLEALENLLKAHEGKGGTQYNAGDIARAAIAKAKGEE